MSHNNYDHQCIGAGMGTPTSFEITVTINLESCECVVDGNESDTTYLTNAALNITGESTNNFCREMGITSYL